MSTGSSTSDLPCPEVARVTRITPSLPQERTALPAKPTCAAYRGDTSRNPAAATGVYTQDSSSSASGEFRALAPVPDRHRTRRPRAADRGLPVRLPAGGGRAAAVGRGAAGRRAQPVDSAGPGRQPEPQREPVAHPARTPVVRREG